MYSVLPAADGRWYVLGQPWFSIHADDRRFALAGIGGCLARHATAPVGRDGLARMVDWDRLLRTGAGAATD